MSQNNYQWSQKSLKELIQFYYTEIRPAMLDDGHDPDEWPRYKWLVDHGYAGISYTLREHYNLTLKEFFVEEVGLDGGTTGNDADGYQWGIHNGETLDAIKTYLSIRSERGEWADSTIKSRRYRIVRYVRLYEELHGPVSLIRPLDKVENKPVENDRCMAVIDELKEQLSTNQSRLKYLQDVQHFYDHFVDFEGAKYNPLNRAEKQYNWSIPAPDNQTIGRKGMRAIYNVTNDSEEKLLILALGAWGLRPNEVASAHVSQFVFTSHTDINFEADLHGDAVVVTATVRTNGTTVDGVAVAVNGTDKGTTDAEGKLRFDLDQRSSSIKIDVSYNGVTQTTEYEKEEGQLVSPNTPVDPYITFEERKNGPSEVTLLFGVEAAQKRMTELYSSDWEGYLFPSSQSSTGHITPETVNNRFKRLAERAGVTVNGQIPTAKMCRRFWYTTYNEALATMMQGLEGIVADQGSASTEVVVKNYLSKSKERRYRRAAMRSELSTVFGKDTN